MVRVYSLCGHHHFLIYCLGDWTVAFYILVGRCSANGVQTQLTAHCLYCVHIQFTVSTVWLSLLHRQTTHCLYCVDIQFTVSTVWTNNSLSLLYGHTAYYYFVWTNTAHCLYCMNKHSSLSLLYGQTAHCHYCKNKHSSLSLL